MQIDVAVTSRQAAHLAHSPAGEEPKGSKYKQLWMGTTGALFLDEERRSLSQSHVRKKLKAPLHSNVHARQPSSPDHLGMLLCSGPLQVIRGIARQIQGALPVVGLLSRLSAPSGGIANDVLVSTS